ncbi:hypothetical protein OTU49_008885 [Cherax quadricarinatus]|uniref:Translation elongation factor EFTs/EF1B dimerisation domain-containing protein n=1 Tax=Cherax quadricarinatus TaxID=27406 RepID=A0AAW0YDL5_CHEQU
MATFWLARTSAVQGLKVWQRQDQQLLHICQSMSAVDKGQLAKLRKQTGFSISNCKNALEMHGNDFEKAVLSEEQLKNLVTSDGKTLGDLLALTIGTIGENMSLPRAVQIVGSPGLNLVGYSHPSAPEENLTTGKFGVILALKTPGVLSEIARQLCVHVIGMNPKTVGTLSDPKADNPDEETTFVHQEFLIDPTVTVGEVLQEENIEIVDFIRFESGEQLIVN